jgi:hypothetical protein
MIFSGGWYSRPEKKYYKKLVEDHIGIPSPFMDEIEKDIRRYICSEVLCTTFGESEKRIILSDLYQSIQRISHRSD